MKPFFPARIFNQSLKFGWNLQSAGAPVQIRDKFQYLPQDEIRESPHDIKYDKNISKIHIFNTRAFLKPALQRLYMQHQHFAKTDVFRDSRDKK